MSKKVIITESELVNLIKKRINHKFIMEGGVPKGLVRKTGTLQLPEKLISYREKILKKIYNSLPYHYYYVFRFMLLKYEPVTNNEVPIEVINTASDMLCEKSKRMGSCNPNDWHGMDCQKNNNKNTFTYCDSTSMYSKSPTYGSSSINLSGQPTKIKNVCWTLGRANVQQQGNNWVVNDPFDFDNVMHKHKFMQSDNFFKVGVNIVAGFVRAVLGTVGIGNFSAGVEQILTQLHALGYPGFTSKWTIPMGNCKCGGKTIQKPKV
jgi:hypothetical protein